LIWCERDAYQNNPDYVPLNGVWDETCALSCFEGFYLDQTVCLEVEEETLSTTETTEEEIQEEKEQISSLLLCFIVIGGVLILAVIIFGICYTFRKPKQRTAPEASKENKDSANNAMKTRASFSRTSVSSQIDSSVMKLKAQKIAETQINLDPNNENTLENIKKMLAELKITSHMNNPLHWEAQKNERGSHIVERENTF
jgi:flagellar basal body-associated protein FliL